LQAMFYEDGNGSNGPKADGLLNKQIDPVVLSERFLILDGYRLIERKRSAIGHERSFKIILDRDQCRRGAARRFQKCTARSRVLLVYQIQNLGSQTIGALPDWEIEALEK